ncbi:hypothetical protein Tco_0363024 [Tanacetum coccineum]
MLKQYQKEVNEIHAEKIARNSNPLALVIAAQQYPDTYYQAPKPHRSYAPPAKTSPSTRSHATTRHKGKEIAKPITPPSELAFEEESNPEQAQKDKEVQKNLALIAKYFKKIYKPTNNNLRTSSNSRNKNVDTTSRYMNENQTGQFGNQMTVTVAGAKEIDTDEEVDEQELEAHYSFMVKIQWVLLIDSGFVIHHFTYTLHENNEEILERERSLERKRKIENKRKDGDFTKKEKRSNTLHHIRFNLRRISLTGFPARSIGSSNADALDSPYLLVLIVGTSQSRQHDKSGSDSYYLSD